MTLLAAAATALAVLLTLSAAMGFRPRLPRVERRGRDTQSWLLQAGVGLTPAQYRLGSMVLGAAVFAGVLVLTTAPAVALVPAAAAAVAPRLAIARERGRRLGAVAAAWPDGLRTLVASVTAGRSLAQAVTGLAAEGPPALRQAFARFPAMVRMAGVVPALEAVKAELADPTSDRVIEVLVVAHERGGSAVADILADLADATGEDLRTLEGVQTDSLEQRINASAVLVMPWLVLLLLTARPGPFRDYYASSGGLLVIAVAAVASLGGGAAIARLARNPGEPRVLVSEDRS